MKQPAQAFHCASYGPRGALPDARGFRAQDAEHKIFRVFQFPAQQAFRALMETTSDWDMVPKDYAIGMDEFDGYGRKKRSWNQV